VESCCLKNFVVDGVVCFNEKRLVKVARSSGELSVMMK
jgi:hypothetical protein